MRRVTRAGVLLGVATVATAVTCGAGGATAATPPPQQYAPVITPADFVREVTNPYYPLKPGTTFIYRGREKAGTSLNRYAVTRDTKTILGVPCVVIRDKLSLNGRLIEDTQDWYAQDKRGDVWYFGEATTQLKDGAVLGHVGSWQAGVQGAQPGIIMPAHPRLGQPYRQEYRKGVAEDMAKALSLAMSATVPYGSFHAVWVMREWSAIDPAAAEDKYYAPGVGFVKLTAAGESQKLVQIAHD